VHQLAHRGPAGRGGVVRGRQVASNIRLALVVPGSGLVKRQAESEGLDEIFRAAGFEWREPGCSMCLAMNADRLEAGERCASTSNRNFEGRQGAGGRTHLVSPEMAAAPGISAMAMALGGQDMGISAMLAASGCNTMQGIGKDMARHWPGRPLVQGSFLKDSWRRSTAPTSTPTRSFRSSS
jgi:hypothetical protein